MSTPTATPAVVTSAIRGYWASVVLSTCLRHAALLQIIEWAEPGNTDLQQLPSNIHGVVFAKCQDLIDRASKRDAEGYHRRALEQRVNGELWDFLKTWRRDAVDVPRGSQNQLNFGDG